MTPKRSRPLVLALLIPAVLCVGLSVFYFTVDTSFLADNFSRHLKHAIGFGGLAGIFVIGAIIVWKRST